MGSSQDAKVYKGGFSGEGEEQEQNPKARRSWCAQRAGVAPTWGQRELARDEVGEVEAL